jgi:hypothetical protein
MSRQSGEIRNCHSVALSILLLIPVTFFIVSLFIPSTMTFDTAAGFIVFRSMLAGGAFNYGTSPDPTNIANDIHTFLAWWSPGQYLAPGAFVWLGTDDGLALSLTGLIAVVVGVIGWARIARRYNVSCFVLVLFLLGLETFHYALWPFRFFNGGETLLFAVLPWSLSALQWAIQKNPAVSFAASLLTAGVLFFAKLSGLFAFAATVAALSVIDIVTQRRITLAVLAMWAGAVVAALLIYVFWITQGQTSVSVPGYALTWPMILFPIAAAAFSAFSLHEFLTWLLMHPSAPVLSNISATSYVLGPLGLLVAGWVWLRLRNTRYRPMAILIMTITAFYSAAFAVMYIRSATAIPYEERYFRYVGILFFLLLLVALDQWRRPLAKAIPILIVAVFAVYGLASYASALRGSVRDHRYDPASGTSMLAVSPVALAYLRSEMAAHNWQHAIAVVPEPEAANGLPRFRILFNFNLLDTASLEDISHQRWAGRADKVFIVMYERMIGNGKADAVLRAFVDYDVANWDQKLMDGMVVYSQ